MASYLKVERRGVECPKEIQAEGVQNESSEDRMEPEGSIARSKELEGWPQRDQDSGEWINMEGSRWRSVRRNSRWIGYDHLCLAQVSGG
jgi:hypothetical protein